MSLHQVMRVFGIGVKLFSTLSASASGCEPLLVFSNELRIIGCLLTSAFKKRDDETSNPSAKVKSP